MSVGIGLIDRIVSRCYLTHGNNSWCEAHPRRKYLCHQELPLCTPTT